MIFVLVSVLQRNIQTETETDLRDRLTRWCGAEAFGICAGWQAGAQWRLQS